MDSSHLLEAQYLKPVFRRLDINNDNKITKRSLKQCLNRLGRSMTYEEIVEAFKNFDTHKSEYITFQEFISVMNQNLIYQKKSIYAKSEVSEIQENLTKFTFKPTDDPQVTSDPGLFINDHEECLQRQFTFEERPSRKTTEHHYKEIYGSKLHLSTPIGE